VHALLLAAALASAPLTPAPPGTAVSGRAATPSTGSVILPGIVLLGLAAAALVLARRKRALGGSRVLEVLDTTSLGPRRSLVVARVGDEALILGVSEAGIALLGSRPASALPAPAAPAAAAVPAGRAAVAAAPARSFDALYAESLEDLELRRKLQQGGAGSVR
jgi:flagellar biogenesis protein FliO